MGVRIKGRIQAKTQGNGEGVRMLPSIMMNEAGLYWMKFMEEDEKVDNIGNKYADDKQEI